jgi:hypothetical protein
MSFPVEFPVVSVYRGDSLSLPFTVSDGGVPRDLSLWSFTSQFRPYADSVEAIDLTVTVEPLLGKVTLTVSPAQTILMGRSGVIDVTAVNASTNETRTWIKFSTDLQKDVTRNG